MKTVHVVVSVAGVQVAHVDVECADDVMPTVALADGDTVTPLAASLAPDHAIVVGTEIVEPQSGIVQESAQ